jgi:CBS domain-containing protein
MAIDKSVQEVLEDKGRKVHSVPPDAMVFDALKVLAEEKIGALPVVEDGKLVGMFSERDYARKVILEGKCSKDTPVREVMTASVCSVSPENTMRECMTLMNKNRFRHLPVVKEGSLVGIISIGDVVRAILVTLLEDVD